MKKIISLLIITILFIPIVVNAAECDTSKVYIDSIVVDDSKGDATELTKASAEDKKINLNLKMLTKDDEIRYKVVLKNDSTEDYEINKNSININSDYIEYTLESDNDDIILKSNTSKTVYLKVKYKTEVDPNSFENGEYEDKVTMKVNLKTDDTPSNPNTGISYLLIISLILIISGISLIIYKKKKLSTLMIIIGIILLPIGVKALCSCDLIVESKVLIKTEDEFRLFIDGSCSGQHDESIPYRIGMTINDYLNSNDYSIINQNQQDLFNSKINDNEYDSIVVDNKYFECIGKIIYPNQSDYQNNSDYTIAYQNAKDEEMNCKKTYGKLLDRNEKIRSKDNTTYYIKYLGSCPTR